MRKAYVAPTENAGLRMRLTGAKRVHGCTQSQCGGPTSTKTCPHRYWGLHNEDMISVSRRSGCACVVGASAPLQPRPTPCGCRPTRRAKHALR